MTQTHDGSEDHLEVRFRGRTMEFRGHEMLIPYVDGVLHGLPDEMSVVISAQLLNGHAWKLTMWNSRGRVMVRQGQTKRNLNHQAALRLLADRFLMQLP